MSEKFLLLQSAKVGVLVHRTKRPVHHYMRWGVLLIGLLCILVGAADLTTRLAGNSLGTDAGFTAFAPLAALNNPAFAPASTTAIGTIIPATLSVPSLGIRAGVELVGKKADGSMGTPQDFKNVAWYSLGAKPSSTTGSAVFTGHVNNALTQAGVFSNLSKIKKGDYVSLSDASGKTLVYKVSEIMALDPSADTSALFSVSGPAQVVLITCDGEWIQDEHQFNKRLVVVAKSAY